MIKIFLFICLICFFIFTQDIVSSEVHFSKRSRFADPNANFERTSNRINRLIQILENEDRKVKYHSIHEEIVEILSKISRNEYKTKMVPSNSVYWYSRQGRRK